MAAAAPPLPNSLKPIQHYLKIATEHERRDPVVAYYCRFYAVQSALEINKKAPECRSYIMYLMDQLETLKVQYSDNEAIHNDVVGQVHVENYALKLFVYADNEDRAGRFGKNVVKSFYSAGMLMDILATFGELSEDIEKNRKYAKWKAAYIHNCLKSGETPISGPMPEEGEEAEAGGSQDDYSGAYTAQPSSSTHPPPQQPSGYQPSSYQSPPPPHYTAPPNTLPSPNIPPQPYAPPSTPQDPHAMGAMPPAQSVGQYQAPSNTGQVQLEAKDYQRAMKLCKFASSALQYEDRDTAIDNLVKALKLLNTGTE